VPRYDYVCPCCFLIFEARRPVAERDTAPCPCGVLAERDRGWHVPGRHTVPGGHLAEYGPNR
jgi:putative FmdB family regulatory protein